MTPANLAGPTSQFTRSLRGVQALIQAMTGAAEERTRRREYMARETERELARGERRQRFEWEKTRAAEAFEAAEKERGLSRRERELRMGIAAQQHFDETGEWPPGYTPGAPGAAPGVEPTAPRRSMRELRDAYVDMLRRQGVGPAEATQAAKGLSRKTLIDELQRARAVAPRAPSPEELEGARIRGPFRPREWFTWAGAPLMGAQAELTRALTRAPGEFPGAGPGFRPALEAPFERAREERLRGREGEVLGLAGEAVSRAEGLQPRAERVQRAFERATGEPWEAPAAGPAAPRPEGAELIPSKKAEYLGRLRAQLRDEGFEPTTIDRMVRTANAEYEQGG